MIEFDSQAHSEHNTEQKHSLDSVFPSSTKATGNIKNKHIMSKKQNKIQNMQREKVETELQKIQKNKQSVTQNDKKTMQNSSDDKIDNDSLNEQNNIIKQQTKENQELNEKYMRVLAELENTRKKLSNQVQEASKIAIIDFVKQQTEVIENLYRAVHSFQPHIDDNTDEVVMSLFQGVDMTLKQMINVLSKNNIERIYPLDQQFDHNKHEIVSYVSLNDQNNGYIVQVIEAGYIIGDRLIKPAKVIVNKNQN